MSSLFNFLEEGGILGQRKVVAQLDDSDWSTPFSLRSVEVNQLLAVNDRSDGTLEASFKIKVAPGKLAKYTKIIRFFPRFLIENKMDMTVVVSQSNLLDSVSWLGGEETQDRSRLSFSVSSNHLRPFHFPGIYGDRMLAINFEGFHCRNSTPSFGIDHMGSFSVKVKPRTDLSTLSYIQTRLNQEYDVELPAGEVGLWFETDWDQTSIVVKSIKPGRYAALKTDIEIGDQVRTLFSRIFEALLHTPQLLEIDGEPVTGDNFFDNAMRSLKEHLSKKGCIVKFRTVDEKLRIISERSVLSSSSQQIVPRPLTLARAHRDSGAEREYSSSEEFILRIDLRIAYASTLLTLSVVDKTARPDYRVENRSTSHVVTYKQKGVTGKRWQYLEPGSSAPFVWDDPFKPHRLMVRIGRCVLGYSRGRNPGKEAEKTDDGSALATQLSYLSGPALSDAATTIVMFDDFGFVANLSVPGSEGKLYAKISSEGFTKVLQISPVRLTICVCFGFRIMWFYLLCCHRPQRVRIRRSTIPRSSLNIKSEYWKN